MKPELIAAVSRAYRQICPGEPVELHQDTEIGSLGLDSIRLLQLMALIEQDLGVWAPDETLGEVATVGELCALLERAQPVVKDPSA